MDFKPQIRYSLCLLVLVSAVVAQERPLPPVKPPGDRDTFDVFFKLFCFSCDIIRLTGNGHPQIVPVEGASEVKTIKLVDEFSNHVCDSHINFGKNGASVFVKGHCDGLFKVCYQEGSVKEVECTSSSKYPDEEELCNTGCHKTQSVIVKEQLSKADCTLGSSFFFSDSILRVKNGCSAKFIVGCSDCRILPEGFKMKKW